MDLLVLHRRLEERVQNVEPDLVRGVHGPLDGHPAEGALTHAAVLVPGPRAAPVFQADNLLRAVRVEVLDRVLIGQYVGTLERVMSVQTDGLVVSQDRRGPAF